MIGGSVKESQDKENGSFAHLTRMGVLVAAMPERTFDPVGDDDCLKVDIFMCFLNSVNIYAFPCTLYSFKIFECGGEKIIVTGPLSILIHDQDNHHHLSR